MNTVITIEARMSSTRLPGKVLMPILGRPMLALMIERLSRVRLADMIVVATTDNPADDPIVELARRLNVAWFRGSEMDVLDRVLQSARQIKADLIVETTGDCPLIDPETIDRVIKTFLENSPDYCSNTLKRTYPRGLDVQVFPLSVLGKVAQLAHDPIDREHVSLYIYQHPEQFRLLNVASDLPPHIGELRLTVNTAEDLELIKGIYEALYPTRPAFHLKDVLDLLDRWPELVGINRHIKQRPVRRPDKVYRAALIGCGKIGSEFADDPRVAGIYSHAGAYAACEGTTLVAVCDRNLERLERCGEGWNIAARYLDAHQMLEEQQPEIVSICTPDSTHYDLICAAIATPGIRAILAEKPLALHLKAAQEVVRLASERDVVLLVNYSRRYSESHINLRDFIKSGRIGEIQTVGGYYTKGILHNGTHWFDLARFLIGEVKRVWGHNVREEDGNDPTLNAFLEFDGGASGYLHGCEADAFSLFEMDIVGKVGRVRVIESGHTFEIYQVGDSPHYTGYRTLVQKEKLVDRLQNVLLNAVEDLVRCLDEGGRPFCSGVEGIEALRIALAVRESALTGQILSLRQS